ncbi:hypothetical protein SS50377_20784 [Spironucleus salmonicida]|uniref:Uncharacterized protein n=1 Tax=Spironucleus salmonicida TaxID=348837 RepID=V6LS73_9EUKA|nr:hypothetical protein SS50377_20784 [Spironucleus salmonicida]|eukprot:EST47108.1 hypothetical protein SS50377_12814 [Spironucleus salmonicida]
MPISPISLTPVVSPSISPQLYEDDVKLFKIPLHHPKIRQSACIGPGSYDSIQYKNTQISITINKNEARQIKVSNNPAPNQYNISSRVRQRRSTIFTSDRFQAIQSQKSPAPNQYRIANPEFNKINLKLNTVERFKVKKIDKDRCGPGSHEITHELFAKHIWQRSEVGLPNQPRFPDLETNEIL